MFYFDTERYGYLKHINKKEGFVAQILKFVQSFTSVRDKK